jgi:putative transcriptional regulator
MSPFLTTISRLDVDSPPDAERQSSMTEKVAANTAPESEPAAEETAPDALELFGSRVREFRKARGLTQHQLAESAGIDRKTINRIENSHYSPTLTNVFAIADALNVPANKLV